MLAKASCHLFHGLAPSWAMDPSALSLPAPIPSRPGRQCPLTPYSGLNTQLMLNKIEISEYTMGICKSHSYMGNFLYDLEDEEDS